MTTFLGYYDNSKKLNLGNIVLLIVDKNHMQKTIYFVSTMIILLFYLLKLMINVLMHNASLQNFLQISSNIFLRFGKCAFLLTMPVKVVSKLLLDRSLIDQSNCLLSKHHSLFFVCYNVVCFKN